MIVSEEPRKPRAADESIAVFLQYSFPGLSTAVITILYLMGWIGVWSLRVGLIFSIVAIWWNRRGDC